MCCGKIGPHAGAGLRQSVDTSALICARTSLSLASRFSAIRNSALPSLLEAQSSPTLRFSLLSSLVTYARWPGGADVRREGWSLLHKPFPPRLLKDTGRAYSPKSAGLIRGPFCTNMVLALEIPLGPE